MKKLSLSDNLLATVLVNTQCACTYQYTKEIAAQFLPVTFTTESCWYKYTHV